MVKKIIFERKGQQNKNNKKQSYKCEAVDKNCSPMFNNKNNNC